MKQNNGLKCCPRCNLTKPVSEYRKDASRVDGYETHCKSCKKEYAKSVKVRNKPSISAKICSCCKQMLNINNFVKHSSNASGYSAYCKDCSKMKRESLKHKEKVYVEFKTCCVCRVYKHRSQFSRYIRSSDALYPMCNDCTKEERELRKLSEKSEPKEYKKCSLCKEVKHKTEFYSSSIAKDGLSYRCTDCSKIEVGKWRTDNKAKITKRKSERYHTDVNFKLASLLRGRLNSAIKNNQKVGSAVEDLGCSVEELKMYLESKFRYGMAWDNHGKHGWHIDHIKPLSSFDLTNRNQFLQACHYTNLQPLWAVDNFKKNAK